MKCPKCGTDMVLGSIYSGAGVSTWIEGEFSRKTWFMLGFRKDAMNPAKIALKAYGCKNCGYIELYGAKQ